MVLIETLGVGVACITGESKKAEGEGIVIVAIKVRVGLSALSVALSRYTGRRERRSSWLESGRRFL